MLIRYPRATSRVMIAQKVNAWQNRSLEAVYPIVYFDAIVVKIRHEGKVGNRAIYLALAINLEGKKEVLGMWSSENESSRTAACRTSRSSSCFI